MKGRDRGSSIKSNKRRDENVQYSKKKKETKIFILEKAAKQSLSDGFCYNQSIANILLQLYKLNPTNQKKNIFFI